MIAFIHYRLPLSLSLLLAAATPASPQTASRDLSRQLDHPAQKSGNSKSTTPAVSPGLCFQTGVGWQRSFPVPMTPETNAPAAPEINGSSGLAAPKSIGERLSNAKQKPSPACAGVPLETRLEKRTHLDRSERANAGTLPSLGPHSPPKGTPSVLPPTHAHVASDHAPDANPDQLDMRSYHAYISSIKLRRLIRNAPDFRTRLQLQQLEKQTVTQSQKAAVSTKDAKAGTEGQHLGRSSSRTSDDGDRARTLLSSADR
jgi:hypothetical protein